MAKSGRNAPLDLKKFVTKEELKDSIRDVARKKDLEVLIRKPELDQSSGFRSWFTANWAGVVVAFIALLTSVYSGCETRKHDKLSVRPHISLGFYSNADGAGWARTISGLGPAIINVFEVTVDGKPVQTWDHVLTLFGIDPKTVDARFIVPTPGTYLLPSSTATAWLLWIGSPKEARAALVKNSHRLQIRIVYCSLYDECWERSGSDLEPKSAAKQKPTIAFGTSQQWIDTHSKVK